MQYEILLEFDHEEKLKYNLVFTSLPIIQIFADEKIIDEPKRPAKIRINNPYYINDKELSREIESLAGIELRGGNVYHYPKLSYSFELWKNEGGDENKDISLLGMRKDDDWLLNAMYNDPMRMRNRVSYDLWNSFAKSYYSDKEPDAIYGIRGKFVEVFVNNNYQGLYCLNERLDRKQLKIKKHTNEIRGLLYKAYSWGAGSTTFDSYEDTTSYYIWDGWE